MSHKPRYVFDTNVVVSALLFEKSVPGKAFYAALDRGEILVSAPLVSELRDVLNRKKFDRYLTREEREQFLVLLLRRAILVEITETVAACRDPKDDKFLELVINGQAASLITGDTDLLDLHPFRGIPVVTPAQFLETLTTAPDECT